MQHAGMEDVTQGPAGHTASLQQEPPQCTSMWWWVGEKEKQRDLSVMKRDGPEEEEPVLSSQPALAPGGHGEVSG